MQRMIHNIKCVVLCVCVQEELAVSYTYSTQCESNYSFPTVFIVWLL